MLKLPVERPTAVTMFFLGVLLFGIISLQRLPRELFPSLDYPQITIVTKYHGAGPEEAEKLISKIIEETVGTVKNIRRVSSISKEGTSIVICEFHWGTDIDFASLEVREKIDLIKERLPKDASEPIVMKYNPFQLEVINLSVNYKKPQKDQWELAELRMLCKKHIKDELERLEGIAKVEIYGGAEKEILVEVDKGRLIANQLSLLDVIKTLRETNITYPAGVIKEGKREFTIKTVGEYKTVNDIKETLIPIERKITYETKRGYRRKDETYKDVVYFSDIATIKEAIKDIEGFSRYNKKDHVSVSIYAQSKANVVKISQLVRSKLNEIKKTKIPHDIEMKIIYDQADLIRSSLNNIYISALQGGALAFFILYLFLRDFVASVIIIISIPLAILMTISLMYFGGISINSMSLGGLALGVGMLIDNSIVVLEKIFAQKIKNPELEKKKIIYSSSSHVVTELISSTLTTVAVFIPLVFVGGVVGQLFKELALTVSFSLLSSILVALFLVPRLALLLNLEKYTKIVPQRRYQDKLGKILNKFSPILMKVIDLPHIKSYGLIFAYLLIGCIVFYFIPKEFMPKIDERRFIMNIALPPNVTLEETNKIVSHIEDFIASLPETKDMIVNIGSTGEKKADEIETLGHNQARIIVQLKNKGRKTTKIISLINEVIKKLPKKDIETEFITQQGLFGSGIGATGAIVLEVKGKDLEKLKRYTDKLSSFLKNNIKEVHGVKVLPQESSPELRIEVDRDKASLFGLSVQDIAATILAAIKGYVPTKLRQEEDEYDIKVRLNPKDRKDLSKIGELTIYSAPLNKHIRVDQLSILNLKDSPTEIRRSEGQRMYIIIANVEKGFEKVTKKIKNFKNKILSNEREISIDITGETLALKESLTNAVFALILSIVVIYMILASQFESLVQPIIVMTTIPLGLIGGIYLLFLTFNTINAISALGFIMLTGIVVNNGILLVSEYNYIREKYPKRDLVEIVIDVTQERLRPILITTLTTIFGLIPLALGIGGQTANSSMAISILGGLFFSLFLTLFFVPLSYLTLTQKMNKIYNHSLKDVY